MITNLTSVDAKRMRSRRVVGGRRPRRVARHPLGIESLEGRQLLTITANPDLFGVIEGNTLTVAAPGVLANDTDSAKAVLQVSASTQPTHGIVSVAPDGSFVYQPSGNYTGTDSFTYRDTDGSGATATGTVNLDVFQYTQEATVFAGPRLASVSSSQGALLNTVLGGLLGTNLNLTAADWTGLASADLNGEQLADALAAELGVSSPSQALTTNATLLQIVNAAATVAQADGNTAEVSALNNLALDLPAVTAPIMLGNLLQVNPNDGSLATTSLNALDLVTGAVQLYNFDNVLTTPTPITVSGSSLGLGSVINSIQVSAQVVEPPIITTGPAGTSFHSSAIRLALNLSLGSDPLDTSDLTAGLLGPLQSTLGPLASVTANASLTNLSLYTEVASGQGIISAVNAIANSVTLQATPGLADVYLGNIPSSLFFDRAHVIDPATDVGYGTVGSLGINVSLSGATVANPTLGIQLKSTALGAAPSASTEVFNGPFPETQTVTTSAAFITNLANTLVNNLSVQLSGNLGTVLTPLTSTIVPLVASAVSTGVTPLVAPVLTGVADPALQLLGTGIGELILAVDGISLIATPIANPDFATTIENTPVTIPVLANDAFLPGDTISITGTTAPGHGGVVVNRTGTVTYTPNTGFLGSDAFTYTITDPDGLTSTASVAVTVTSPPPIANDDTYSAVSGTPLVVSSPGVLANDTDPAGLPLTSLLVSQPAHGTLALNPDGSFTYTPSASYVGTDSFTYRDSDQVNLSAAATVSFTVTAPPRVVRTFPVYGTVGMPLTRIPLLTFSDPGTKGSPLLSTIIINWGDGTPNSTGTITPFSGEYLVAGSHTYESAGTFPVIVTVDDPNNGSFTVVLPAFIKPLPTIGSLSGTVYNDLNGDGLDEPGKPGLAGQTVVLAGVDYLGDKVVMTTKTGADGSYHFMGLSTGIYAMQETSFPVGSLADVGSLGGVAGPNYVTSIAVVGNVAGTGYNFGERVSSEIGGTVYLDANNNKQDDANEFGVANIPVTLSGTDFAGNRVYLTEVTAADGTYNFVGVAAGTYQITVAQPPNFNKGQATVGSAGGIAEINEITGISLPAGSDATGYDFGELIKPGCALATPAYRNLLRYGPNPSGIPASAFKGLVVKPSNPIAFYLPTLTSEINNANSQAKKSKTSTKAVKVVHAASVEDLQPAESVMTIRVAKPKVSRKVHPSAKKK